LGVAESGCQSFRHHRQEAGHDPDRRAEDRFEKVGLVGEGDGAVLKGAFGPGNTLPRRTYPDRPVDAVARRAAKRRSEGDGVDCGLDRSGAGATVVSAAAGATVVGGEPTTESDV
jgi:hypothetical protein